jgi:hypothetical protein
MFSNVKTKRIVGAGTVAAGLFLALSLGASPAKADWDHRGYYEHEHHWHQGYYRRPDVVIAPPVVYERPPVYYAPPPAPVYYGAPALNVTIPLR